MELDITKLIQDAEALLERRNRALARTREEIELLKRAGAPPQALAAAHLKQNRQNDACMASNQLLAALDGAKTKKTK